MRGGPGEAQIELDRRMIDDRIKKTKERLKQVQRQRGTQRRARSRNGVFKVSLVGYTNAGKSTLFNALTKARAYAANQLFATLDTTTRSLYLEQAGASVSLSDTVGFIRDLPHKLVEAFRATLQEAADADLLLHVVDAASPVLEEQMSEVERVLAEIGAADVPQILVYNKQDLLADDQRPREPVDAVLRTAGGSEPTPRVFVSAIDGSGLAELRQLIATAMQAQPLIPDERDPRFDADSSHSPDSGEPSPSDPSQA
jgi:GTP-binding protein HflX